MTALAEMLRKARAAVLRRGVPVEDVDDLVQEAFVRVEQYERDHIVQSREALLVRSAINLSIDRARRLRHAPISPGDVLLDGFVSDEPDQAQVAEARARLAHLGKGIAALPEQTRRILLARRIDGLAYAEIAKREGLKIRAVEQRVARATLLLMKWMDGW
jgi:RNA polymerase sigma factor (sigma-70 family)